MKRFDQINMIPFIDIMLVLLAIVLTTASFVSKGLIEVDLPQAQQIDGPNSEPQKPLEIAIKVNGEIFFKEESILFEALDDKLSGVEKNQLIILRIDKQADFEYFVKTLAPIKAGGFENISIQADQD